MNLKCRYCGKEFETKDSRVRFCCEDCRREYWNKKRREYAKVMRATDEEWRRKRNEKSSECQYLRLRGERERRYREQAAIIIDLAQKPNGLEEVTDYLMNNFFGHRNNGTL